MELGFLKIEIDKLLTKYNYNFTSIGAHLRSNKELKQNIINATSYVSSTNFPQRIYNIKYDTKVGQCIYCAGPTTFDSFRTGYKNYCRKCIIKDPIVQEKIKKTNMERYGVENPFAAEVIKNKIKQHNIATYGMENVSQVKELQDKKVKTWLDKYGIDNPNKTSEIKDKIKNTKIEKYGVNYIELARNKRIETFINKYGVENPSQIKEFQDKKKETFINNYGFDHPLKSEIVKNKSKQTSLQKYGTASPRQSEIVKAKYKQTCLEKYGVSNYIQSEEHKNDCNIKFYNKLINSDRLKNLVVPLFTLDECNGRTSVYKFKCVKCSTIFSDHLDNGKIPRCPRCYESKSIAEVNIFEWLQSIEATNIHLKNRKLIAPYELDIYLPDYKLAIEFNGLYWHSDLSGKDRAYHLNKTKMCEAKGTQLLHIFEDEWIDKQEIVKSIIKNKLGLLDSKIFARKCEIKEVLQEESYKFLFNNHLQEPIYSKYNFGLYYNDELVYLICLSKPRFNKNYQFELVRSCSKINTQIIGGFDKLIKYSVNSLTIKSLLSYVDKRYFNGSGYKNNWVYVGSTLPNYYYLINYKTTRVSRIRFQKHKLEKLFPEHYDENLTEWQIMQLAGYDRIWDCGNLIFEYKG